MTKCCICGAKLTNPDAPVLFFSENTGAEKCVCDNCDAQMTVLMECQEPASVKKAINYFYTCIEDIDDGEVKSHVADMIENNSDVVEELSEKDRKAKPVSERQKDYFADKAKAAEESVSSVWIEGMRIFLWLAFIIIVISGIVCGGSLLKLRPGLGLGIIAGAIIGGFLLVAGLMIFLEMAEDLKYIRKKLSDK